MKWCSAGKHFVEREHFSKLSKSSDGLQATCRDCRRAYREKNADAIKDKKQAYREANRERINADLRERYAKCDKQQHYQNSLAWRAKHPERYKELMRKNYVANRTERLKACRSRYVEKREEIIELQMAYYRANTERYRTHRRNRKARMKAAVGSFTPEQWQEKLAYYGHRCYLCLESLDGKVVHADHRIPIIRGGTNWIANIAPACSVCNLRKSVKTEREYREVLQAA